MTHKVLSCSVKGCHWYSDGGCRKAQISIGNRAGVCLDYKPKKVCGLFIPTEKER